MCCLHRKQDHPVVRSSTTFEGPAVQGVSISISVHTYISKTENKLELSEFGMRCQYSLNIKELPSFNSSVCILFYKISLVEDCLGALLWSHHLGGKDRQNSEFVDSLLYMESLIQPGVHSATWCQRETQKSRLASHKKFRSSRCPFSLCSTDSCWRVLYFFLATVQAAKVVMYSSKAKR